MGTLGVVMESMMILTRLGSRHCLLGSESLRLIAMNRLIFLD